MDKRIVPILLLVLVGSVGFAAFADPVVAQASNNTTPTPTPDPANNTTATPTAGNNTTTTPTDSGDGDSEWSKARILATVQDHIDRHSRVDVSAMESYYQNNKDDFSAVEQRYVEAWIEWYRTGDKPGDGLHPALLPQVGEDTRANETFSASDLDQGRREVSDSVRVLGFEFRQGSKQVVMVVEADAETTMTVMDSAGSYKTGQFIEREVQLREGRNYIKLPAQIHEGDQLITIRHGDGGAILKNDAPPLLQYEKNEYMWWAAGGIGLGMALMALMWFLRREKIYQRFRPAARLISGQVRTTGGLVNRFTGEPDDPEDDEFDDGIRGLIQRYASLRSLVWTGVKVAIVLYFFDLTGMIDLPLPQLGDETKIVAFFFVLGYSVVGPTLLKPILEAVYNPALEKIQLLDVDGSTNGGFWAKKGVFREDYDIESETGASVPTRETSTGQRCYLLRSIDREEQTAEPAFSWQVEEVEEIAGIDAEELDVQGRRVAIDQILADAKRAAFVIKDMAVEANNGKNIRKAFPLLQVKIAMEQARDIATGINRAVTGSSIEPVLDDMISSYDSKREEIEDKFERQSDVDKSLDEIQNELENQSDAVDAEPDENGGDGDE